MPVDPLDTAFRHRGVRKGRPSPRDGRPVSASLVTLGSGEPRHPIEGDRGRGRV